MSAEQNAAARLLNYGIKVRVTAPLLFRLFRKRTIGLYILPPNQGTLLRIDHLFLSTGLTPEQLEQLDEMNAHELHKAHGMTMTRIIATAWLYGKWRGKLFTGIVARWLYWHLNNTQMLTVVGVLVMLSSKESFTSSIRSVAAMRMTVPNLSQKSQGS
ncbi:hypothetical protein J3L18_23230 [Mucilaginibacter gossypii]|uniref:hypothetical protein n=1 Tax=Mucilaginibacter gossypii TaxID=551996 RepID=UPI000DCDBFB4|nr:MULTISPECIES: hypothetical protein [Mucilaginibacter]QTE36028.1 hypothetical protein J3L18_23230 [Mucilaginibacter gossypii]RAV56702.1 hypothetical protein DIU36_14975 [Mucilaginibacter rubeus]